MDSGVALIFDSHTRRRMRQRGITEEIVRAVLGNYDEEYRRDEGRTEYWGDYERRRLLVVLEGETEPYLVVTVIDQERAERR